MRRPGWHLSPPPEDFAAYAKQRKLETNVARADFDDDGTADTAVLVLASSNGKSHRYIAVCLDHGRRTHLYTIPDPYCGDGIGVAPKGTKAYDYDTGKSVTYRTNEGHAYCFEKAGGTYVFKSARFELVVDSD